jgi:hypothetical protein
MKMRFMDRPVRSIALLVAVLTQLATVYAGRWGPSAPDYTGRKGKTIYVSKKGDNSDGSSWQKAFHTIQAGLSAVCRTPRADIASSCGRLAGRQLTEHGLAIRAQPGQIVWIVYRRVPSP